MAYAKWIAVLAAAAFATGALAAPAAKDGDPYLWLADIHGAKALAWVKEQDARSDKILKSDPFYASTRATILKSLDVKDRIPLGTLDRGHVYNFWQDAKHVRGIWRRATLAEYRKAEAKWETLLDIDALDAETRKDYAFQGGECSPSFARCLVVLSPGGSDAGEYREIDPKTHQILAEGFSLPVAKSTATYLDDDDILFATDFGPGSMTTSSYPRIVKLWHRGGTIAGARTVFAGKAGDVGVDPYVFRGPSGTVTLFARGITTFNTEYDLYAEGKTVRLPLPWGADLQGITDGRLIVKLREDWMPRGARKVIKRGSLVAFDVAHFDPRKNPRVTLLFTPGPHETIDTVAAGRDAVYASIYRDVKGSVHAFRFAGGKWHDEVLDLPMGGSTAAVTADAWSPDAMFTYESFLVPPTLYETTGDAEVAAI